MERYYNIVGTNICITGKDEEMYTNERRLEPFRIEEKNVDHNYLFSIVDELDDRKGVCIYKDASKIIYQDGNKKIRYTGIVSNGINGAYIRCESDEHASYIQIKRNQLPEQITSKVVLNALGIESLVLRAGGFILHASFIHVNGRAILFTAPSGTGKSTQAELWKALRNADIINGDRAVVKVEDENVLACGLPFAGSSKHCKNAALPLAAIVYLEQAEKTKLEPLSGADAFRKIWEQITIPLWEEDATEQISDKLIFVLTKIPVYQLSCTPDESAVIALENMLEKER